MTEDDPSLQAATSGPAGRGAPGRLVATFFVPSRPAPQGSKRGFAARAKNSAGEWYYTGKVAQKEMSPHHASFRDAVAAAARQLGIREPADGALILSCRFYVKRPKSVPATDRRRWHRRPTTYPDLSKLMRSVEDSLTGSVWTDDARVVGYKDSGKFYAEDGQPTGVRITVWEFPDVRPGEETPRW